MFTVHGKGHGLGHARPPLMVQCNGRPCMLLTHHVPMLRYLATFAAQPLVLEPGVVYLLVQKELLDVPSEVTARAWDNAEALAQYATYHDVDLACLSIHLYNPPVILFAVDHVAVAPDLVDQAERLESLWWLHAQKE